MWKIPDDGIKWVDAAHVVLRGHRSIVNQVRYNSASCILASSGVEKIIKIWSPFNLGEDCLGGLKAGSLILTELFVKNVNQRIKSNYRKIPVNKKDNGECSPMTNISISYYVPGSS